ncbi:hypothetical protein KKF64_01245 [Patescibacteria group bacterium]|nr:hypothetical protein [Patescibacteria group bacterium]
MSKSARINQKDLGIATQANRVAGRIWIQVKQGGGKEVFEAACREHGKEIMLGLLFVHAVACYLSVELAIKKIHASSIFQGEEG